MRTETRYVCETCGTRYRSEALARTCEATVLPPCPVSPGDHVLVSVRYGEPEPDVVREVSVRSSATAFAASDIPDDHRLATTLLSGAGRPLHQWVVTLSERHQMGKDDDSHTDVVDLTDIVAVPETA